MDIDRIAGLFHVSVCSLDESQAADFLSLAACNDTSTTLYTCSDVKNFECT